MNRKFWYAVFALVGTTVGAGIFGLPFVFAQSGFLIGFLELSALSALMILVQQIVGEIALRTKDGRRLIGYDKEYLGSGWQVLSALAVTFGTTGAILVYLILSGEFISVLAGIDRFFGTLIFFSVWFLAIMIRPKAFGRFELYLGGFSILFIILLSVFSIKGINLENLIQINLKNFFLPYGVILFAMAGYTAIPIMEDILGEERNKLRKAITVGTLIPAAVYILFALAVVGISGALTSQDAVSGWALVANSRYILILGSMLGLLTISGASLSLGVFLKESFHRDLGLPKQLAWFLTGGMPLTLFLLGARDFITIIGFFGALIFGFRVIDILYIHKKSKASGTKPPYEINLPPAAYYAIAAFAVLGAILEIWYIIR